MGANRVFPNRRLLAARLQGWMPAVFWGLLFVYAIWPWLQGNGASSQTMVFYGFSTLGDAMTQSIFPRFQQQWRDQTGKRLEFAGSFSGSGTVTNQLIMGVPAQLALLSLEPDAKRLSEKGVIPAGSWNRLPNRGVLNRTPFIILVRHGNPKGIHDFADLARPNVKVVHPDPLTSGAANWAILAEYGAGMRHHPDQPDAGYNLLLGIWRNVVAQAHSARAARAQFENGFGDALITYEQEALWDRAQGKLKGELIYPSSTILSEHILVEIGRNVDSEDRLLVSSFVNFLWSSDAQRLFVACGFRSVDESLNSANSNFGKMADPFLVDALGGWDKAKIEIIDGLWKGRVLKQLGRKP
jgi:sulfate/thiosulfate transport system substrate-binding protein